MLLKRNLTLQQKIQLFLKSPMALMGLIFFIIGLMGMKVFLPNVDYKSWYFNDSNTEITIGQLQAMQATSISLGNSKVFQYDYAFLVDGQQYYDKSYDDHRALSEGAAVDIEFIKGDPDTSRIKNMRTAPLNWLGLLVIIFPLTSGLILVFAYREINKKLLLLNIGQQTNGTYMQNNQTSQHVNGHAKSQLTFEYVVHNNTYQLHYETSKPQQFTIGQTYPLLYHPQQPESAVLLIAFPESIRGEIEKG